MSEEIKLELRNISKSFPGVKALDQVSFRLKKGTTHVLCGENGAGKSTLMKILDGIYRQDEGEIYIDGRPVQIKSPVDARANGIAMIFQELSYVPDLTVAENVYLGSWTMKRRGKIDWKTIRKNTEALLTQEGFPYSHDTLLRSLSVADIQLIEILKAVSFDAQVLIMDEPTSSISDKEVTFLFDKIEQLKKRGVSIIYISHKMDEIFKIADEITVLRDGAVVGTRNASEVTIDQVIEMMVGRKLENQYPKTKVPVGEKVLEVKGFCSPGIFKNISFDVRAGEIVGFAGLVGAGRTEVMNAVFGMDPHTEGEVYIKGKPVQIRHVWQAIAHGLAMVSEDRRQYGIVPVRNIIENTSLASLKKFFYKGRCHKRKEKEKVREVCERMNVKTPSLETKIENLSGGNQQKVILAKWMLCSPDVLIMDEPTRGIDVGAKSEIYQLMEEFARDGKGIVMVSSELPELIGMCDRIYVMHEGVITGCLDKEEFSQEAIMNFAVKTAG
ncbi:sugar ABC transporter ATP-binding protein [Qiania dongpingensis]|uniref:Sugar ABC transporter ATP-binding protein n=1 Tax=Qiania dongpingensis TaxID=2763669 RepID=A0A7G9G1E6_9FIRM|nr:sugar ABC transporter ATP-binding protein [Qiania dongpingensis]QNM04628.1 sugar ABC transporter ATP-binding protein [Qiania dongpingensis]